MTTTPVVWPWVPATEEAHHARWVEVVEAALADPGEPDVKAYGYDDVPGYGGNEDPRPRQHVQVSVSQTSRISETTMGGRSSQVQWRVDLFFVAARASHVRAMRDRLNRMVTKRAPFDGGSLIVRDEGDSPIDETSEGAWGGLVTWTYLTSRRTA